MKNLPAMISAIVKYLPVILVAFEALRQVQEELEKVNQDLQSETKQIQD